MARTLGKKIFPFDSKYSPIESGQVSTTKVLASYELGYSYFFNEHMVGRFFVRGLNEDQKAWSAALSGATGAYLKTGGMNSSFAGQNDFDLRFIRQFPSPSVLDQLLVRVPI